MSFKLQATFLLSFMTCSLSSYAQGDTDDDEAFLFPKKMEMSQEQGSSLAYKQEDQQEHKAILKKAKKRKAEDDIELRENIKRTRSSLVASREKVERAQPTEWQEFSSDAKWKTCFTPKEHCLESITNVLQSATKSIYVQAYILSSQEIADALVTAFKRGVDVKVLVDRQQLFVEWSKISFLIDNQVPVYSDILATLAHNKVIVVDKKTVITGSYNFSCAAEIRNAENIIVIHDPKVAQAYLNGFIDRYQDCYRYLSSAGGSRLYASPSRPATLAQLKKPPTPLKSARNIFGVDE